LNEYDSQDQRVLGSQLGEDVGRHVIIAGDVVELKTFKVVLKLAHLSAVGIHCFVLDIACLVDLVDDDLGVAVCDESLDSEGNNDV
jgi:hypothetical protein